MKIGILITALLLTTGITPAFAENAKPADKKAAMEMSKEDREQMAVHHEKMAACLRSDKSVQACHEEMKEACSGQMGEHACPMMGEMGGKHGMHKGSLKKK